MATSSESNLSYHTAFKMLNSRCQWSRHRTYKGWKNASFIVHKSYASYFSWQLWKHKKSQQRRHCM